MCIAIENSNVMDQSVTEARFSFVTYTHFSVDFRNCLVSNYVKVMQTSTQMAGALHDCTFLKPPWPCWSETNHRLHEKIGLHA